MDFSIAEPIMLKYGITQAQIDELKALAAQLPENVADGDRVPVPAVPGLTRFESELLMARMMEEIAPEYGIQVFWRNLLDTARYPDMTKLLRIAQRRLRSQRGQSASTPGITSDIDRSDLGERQHERA
jgi:hypothetical protein